MCKICVECKLQCFDCSYYRPDYKQGEAKVGGNAADLYPGAYTFGPQEAEMYYW